MTITIHNTSKIVEINGMPARIWEGQTDSGIPIHCFITHVGVAVDLTPDGSHHAQFQRELAETTSPSKALEEIPLRMIL